MADSDDRTVATAIRRIWTSQGTTARGFHFRGQFFILQVAQRAGPTGKFRPGVELCLGGRKERAVPGEFWPLGAPAPSVDAVRRAADELLAASVMAS